MALGGGVRVQTTYFGLSLASWLAVAVAGLLFRFLPWLPGVLYRWFRDVLDQRENNGQEKTPPPG